MGWQSSLLVAFMAAELRSSVQGLTCSDKPRARTFVLVGGTGSGKSTFADVCLSGDEGRAPAEVSDGHESKTEETTCFIGEYLNNSNHRIQRKTFRIIDSPGFGDTGGKDVRNMKMLSHKIKEMGKIDAVVMLWKLEQNGIGRMTRPKKEYFTQMRMVFGHKIWRRLVMVYTFSRWSHCTNFVVKQCDCFSQEDLAKVHATVMNNVVHYMQNDVLVGEKVCENDEKPGCIPTTTKIPYMASGAYLKLIRKAKENGLSFFDPDAYPSWQDNGCANKGSYDAIQFQNFWEGLNNVSESPLLNVNQPNAYTECQDALNGTVEWRKQSEDVKALDVNKMKQTARHIMRCFECRIGRESRRIMREYEGSKKMQVELAHVLRDLDHSYVKYLDEAHGFGLVQPLESVLAFQNYGSYFKCHSVTSKDLKQECFFELSRYHKDRQGDDDPAMNKKREEILETLKAKMSCKCHETDNSDERRFTCEYQEGREGELQFQCPRDHVCVSDMFSVDFGLDPDMNKAKLEYCKPAKKCKDEDLTQTCDNIHYFPNPINTFKVCKSEQKCHKEECCTQHQSFQIMSLRTGISITHMCMAEVRQSAVEMRPCNAMESHQKWKWKDHKLLMNPALGKCIQAEGDRQWVSLQHCNRENPRQHWKYNPSGYKKGTLENHDSNKILDAWGAETYIADKTGVIIWGDNRQNDYSYWEHQEWKFLPRKAEISQKFQEVDALVDARGGISASLTCVSAFVMLTVLLAASAVRRKWNSPQDTEDVDELLKSDMHA